jgi:hypothetical protein
MDRRLVTEVLVPTTSQRGSGYVVGPGLILTAYHVVSDKESSNVNHTNCLVRAQGDWEDADPLDDSRRTYSSAHLIWPKAGSPAPSLDAKRRTGSMADIALLQASRASSNLIRSASWAKFNVGQMLDHFDCRFAGFPLLSMLRLPDRRRFRDLTEDERALALSSGNYAPDILDLTGKIAPNTFQRSSYYLINGTSDQPTHRALWKGLSGAAVFDTDGYIVGVVTDNISSASNDGVVAERLANPVTDVTFRHLLGIDLSRDALGRNERLFVRDSQSIAVAVAVRARSATNHSLLTPTLGSDASFELIQIFVKPEFRRRPKAEKGTKQSLQLELAASTEDVIKSYAHVLIVGDPGSGKSMAAADLAFRLSEPWSQGRRGEHFPLLLMAKDLEYNPNGLPPNRVLSSAFAAAIESHYPPLPDTFLTDAQRAGVAIILIIDGLDEIVGDRNVSTFLKDISGMATSFGKDVRLVLFSRPLGLDHIDSALKLFAVYSLLPFNEERRSTRIEKIFRCAGRELEEAQIWHGKIKTMPLASLLDNPALLTMLAISTLNGIQEIQVETRSDILRLFIDTLLKAFDERIRPEFERFVKETLYDDPESFGRTFRTKSMRMELLVNFGFAATEARELDVAFFRRAFETFRSTYATVYSTFDAADYADVLRQFLLRAGIVVGEKARLQFCHNLIREYLASVVLERAIGDDAERWLLRWRAPLWRETILMALPGWLRRDNSDSSVFDRLIAIGNSSYDGALFCGAALLEHLPISPQNGAFLFQLALAAIERWNACANLLLGEEMAYTNPSALVKRLVAQNDMRGAMAKYLKTRQGSMHCPLSSSELVRLFSDLGDPSLVDSLSLDGTGFIASEAIAALFDMGKEKLAERRAREFLGSLRADPKAVGRLLSYLGATGRINLLAEIAAQVTIVTPVRLLAASVWFMSSESVSAASAISNCFYGTAHGDQIPDVVVSALVNSRILWRRTNIGNVSPDTLKSVLIASIDKQIETAQAMSEISDDKRSIPHADGPGRHTAIIAKRIDTAVRSSRKLLFDLYKKQSSGVLMIQIMGAVEPIIGAEGVLRALHEDYRARVGDLTIARGMAERGDISALVAIVESGSKEDSTLAQNILEQLKSG